jgi:transcriptional regulator with XRE-family HTH domain
MLGTMARAKRAPLLDPGQLREARVRAGLSQQEVADRLGLQQPTISQWERGKTGGPTRAQLARLRAFLDLAAPEDQEEGSSRSPVGEWLARTRAQRGMTRRELSDAAGVSVPQIFNIEKGQTSNPRAETRQRLAAALGEEPPKDTVEVTETDAQIQDVGVLSDFDPHDSNDLPAEPGVYVFYDVSDRPIYVGESDNIRQRLAQHLDKFWYKRPIVETAAYVRIPNRKLRRQVEATMIRFLKSNAVINKQNVQR